MEQHVQLPNNFREKYEVSPSDLLIYLYIRRHMDGATQEAFPSLRLLSEESGASIPTIRKCVERLTGKYFDIKKDGRKQIYIFNKKYKSYEPFSYEFLDNPDLTFQEKAGIVGSQEFMFKDTEGIGKISYTNKELADKMNVSESYVEKFNRALRNKGLLKIVHTNNRDLESGERLKEKIYYLNEIGQAIVWKLKDHEDRIAENEFKLESHSKDIEMLKRKIEELENENKKLKGTNTELML